MEMLNVRRQHPLTASLRHICYRLLEQGPIGDLGSDLVRRSATVVAIASTSFLMLDVNDVHVLIDAQSEIARRIR
jgi:hypothetical protein